MVGQSTRSQSSVAEQLDQADIVERLQGFGVEGPILPPLQIGSRRVPCVSRLSVVRVTGSAGVNAFRLRWHNPPIPNYYVLDGLQVSYRTQDSRFWTVVPGSPHSPVEIALTGTMGTSVTFAVQTRLANGQISPLSVSPRTSANFQ